MQEVLQSGITRDRWDSGILHSNQLVQFFFFPFMVYSCLYIAFKILAFQVGILGNAADFYENGLNSSTLDNNQDRRQMMIAFDMRYGEEKVK